MISSPLSNQNILSLLYDAKSRFFADLMEKIVVLVLKKKKMTFMIKTHL